MKKILTASLALAALAASAHATLYTNFQFADVSETGLAATANSGTDNTGWNFNLSGAPGEGATDGLGTLFLGKNATSGSSNISKDYTRKVTFASSITTGTYTFEYRLSSWNFATAAADANGNNQEGITLKLVGTAGNINLISALNSSDSNVRARHALSGLGGTAAQNNIEITNTDLVVRITGNLDTGTFATSISEQGAAFTDLITDGTGLTDITEIILTVEGGQPWVDDNVGIDYMTLDVVPEPSSTALLGLGGLALLLRRRKG